MKVSVGIVGTGRFGRVLEKLFEGAARVKLASRSKTVDGERVFNLEEVLACDLVFPAVPIGAFEGWLEQSGKIVKPGVLVVSVCSVMGEPKRWMKQWLPRGVDFVASHPVFGPASSDGGRSFRGLHWVVDGGRVGGKGDANVLIHLHGGKDGDGWGGGTKLEWLKGLLKSRGIVIHEMSALEHDKTMARSQAVAFLVGRIGQRLGFSEGVLDTVGFRYLLANQKIYEGDSRELLIDMFRFNPEARKMLVKFKESVLGLEREILRLSGHSRMARSAQAFGSEARTRRAQARRDDKLALESLASLSRRK